MYTFFKLLVLLFFFLDGGSKSAVLKILWHIAKAFTNKRNKKINIRLDKRKKETQKRTMENQ